MEATFCEVVATFAGAAVELPEAAAPLAPEVDVLPVVDRPVLADVPVVLEPNMPLLVFDWPKAVLAKTTENAAIAATVRN